MKIGILQTGHALEQVRDRRGDYDSMFEQLLKGHSFSYATFNVVDGEFPDGPEAAEGWLITGSRHGVYEDHPWIAPLEELIRAIHAANKPLIGICFGHQIIAQALGGKVEKYADGWVVGQTDYQINGERVSLNAWHQDQVVELPPGAEVIGSNDMCRYAALTYGDTVLTFQAHPEFDDFVMENLLELRGAGLLSLEMMEAAWTRFAVPKDSNRIAGQMAAHFLKARAK